MKTALCVPFLALLLLQDPVEKPPQEAPQGEADSARIARALEELCTEFAGRAEIDGLSIAIGTAEKPLVARGWGYADAGHARAADASTQVRLGRLTDLFLAVGAMHLVEEGRLKLEAKVSELLPKLGPLAHDVRVHHLLDHTSGLAPYRELPAQFERRGRQGTPAEELLALVSGREALFEPGARHEESNANTTLLALVIEAAAGADLDTHLRRSVLAPAGVYRTAACDQPKEEKPAEGKEPAGEPPGQEAKTVPVPATYELGLTDVLSTEELCSSAEELYRFTRALHDGELLEEASLQRLFEPIRLTAGTSAHGPILRKDQHDGVECLMDSGEQAEDRILVAHYPVSHLTVVVLAHGASAGREGVLNALRQRLARIALTLPEPGVVDLEIEAELRPRLLGNYQFGTTRVEIAARGRHLALIRPREPDLELLYQGKLRFVAASDANTQVVFQLPEDDGPAPRFVLRERGFESSAVRMD